MRKTIWKFELTIKDSQIIEMPVGAEILDVQNQTGIPCIWVLLDPTVEKEFVVFEMFGTGHEVCYDMGIDRKHIGTFQLSGGRLVYHLFQRIN